MIYKSYLVEKNLDIIPSKIVLFYGENIGLLDDFRDSIVNKSKEHEILRFSQDDILKNSENFHDEITNISLFNQNKIFLIHEVNDKFLNILQKIKIKNNGVKVFLFAKILEKKSKLRIFFEKSSELGIVACYQDNEINIKKFVQQNLLDFKGITQNIINLIIENTGNDRAKIKNELEKIKTYFINKKVDIRELEKLLNLKQDGDFNIVKNSALCGKKEITNKLLSSSVIDSDQTIFYLSTLNQRFLKLNEIYKKNNNNLESTINELKPPIFWKEKPIFLQQLRVWNEIKINKALQKVYDVELKIKLNSNLDKKIVLKKLIIDICELANAA